LNQVRRILEPGDSLLLGTDLEKPPHQLIAAYDDELGVTAAFNLNLLARINQELGANFDLGHFKHVAKINSHSRSVEMHLRSTCRQTVDIPASGIAVNFQEGETIWTESSHKYSTQDVIEMARSAGFRCDVQWVDHEWPFAENLLIAV
jgi:L-histidine Nalpha-methyltransferase